MKTNLVILICFALVMGSCTKLKKAETPATLDSTVVENTCTQKVIHARVYLKPEKVAEFIEAAKMMVDSSNMEPGCISYQLFQDPYNTTQFIFVEVWKDQAAIDAHFAMPYFTAWGPRTADWMAKSAELNIFSAGPQQ